MSLGFLTESALVPSKAKAIKVDSKSIVDLKAVVFREQERKKAATEASGLRSKRGARAKELQAGKKSETNAGVEKRRQRDEDEEALGDDERAKKKRSRQILIEKAKLYDQMARGERLATGDVLINFDAKTTHRDHEFTEAAPKPAVNDGEWVEIVDEFGRTKKVTKREYEASLPPPPPTEGSKSVGSFVVSQWEKTLNSQEKSYLTEVHAEAQHAKLTLADKKRQKELRREKLKLAFNNTSTPAVAPSSTISAQASRDASAFLSSLL
ncbi:hypothetical protein SDRG_05153, partial [Saprolegnia diclina VS20]